MKAILLHELQHKIQESENFARGGNPEHSMTFPEFNDELNKIMQDIKDKGLDPKLLKDADKASLIDKAGFNVYQRLKGEVEARAVQERSTYSPHMLKNVPPARTQALDIPERQQIVVRGRNQAASIIDDIKEKEDALTRARASHAKFEEIAATSDNPRAKDAVKQSAAD